MLTLTKTFVFSLLLIAILGVALPLSLRAQNHHAPPARSHAGQNFQFEHLTIEHGLPHTRVTCILQDGKGFLWFGTKDGLVRYDGYDFKVYKHDPADSTTLSNNTIWAFFEDHAKTLWINNTGGFDKFDRLAETFMPFSPASDEATGFHARLINNIFEDRAGTFWMGCSDEPGSSWGGLYKLDRPDSPLIKSNESRGKFTRYHHDPGDPHSLSDNAVCCIVDDDSGNLWIGTKQHGLNRFDPKAETPTGAAFTCYTHDPGNPHSLSNNNLRYAMKDRDGNLWFATFGGGLNRYDPQTDGFTRYQHDPHNPNSLHQDYVETIFQDAAGMIWIANGVLSRLDPHSGVFEHFRFSSSHDDWQSSYAPLAIHEDRSHNLWVGTRDQGIFKIDLKPKKFAHYKHELENPNGLSDNDVSFLYEDSQGRIWIALREAGLNLFDPPTGRFMHFAHEQHDPQSLSHNHIYAMYEDHLGVIWIGTRAGLNRFASDRKKFTQYRHDPADPHSLSHDQIMAIFEDRAGTLWIGTATGGLNKFDRQTEKFYSFKPKPDVDTRLGANDIEEICEDQKGNLWVATFAKINATETLYHFDRRTGQFTPVKAAHNDDPRWGHYLYKTRDGTIWGGYYSLCKLDIDKKQFTRYRVIPNDAHDGPFDSAHNSVLWVHEDEKGRLWCGTRNGLHRFDPRTGRFVAHYDKKDGLPGELILKIIEDDGGKLWLLTDGGLCVFDEQAPPSRRFSTFGTNDGVINTPHTYSAFIKSKDGDIYWGGNNGIYRFYPDVAPKNRQAPPLQLTQFKIFNEIVRLDTAISEIKTIHLRYDESFFSFAFSALDFTNPRQNQYAYKLEGLDRDWVQAGNKHEANYTHVPPGRYTFRVKGSNNDGVWNEQGVSVQVIITPPFWQTWWFRLLVLGIVAGALEALHKYRVAKRLEIERTRQRIARDLHDEIGSGLSSIALSSELLQDKTMLDEKGKAILARMNCTARQLAESVNELVWTCNPGNDKLDNLLLRMKDATAELLSLKGIAFTFDFPSEKLPQAISMDFRRNLFLIYKELLHNIIKHSQAGRVEISLEKRDGVLILKVADDGIGFDSANINGNGNGLNNMKARAEKLGGRLKLKSQPQGGMEAVLTVKIP